MKMSGCFSFPPVSTEGEQTEKSPSDEGFTDLEPTVNGSTEEVEGTSSKTQNTIIRDQQGLEPGCPGQGDFQDKSRLLQLKGKLDDEEDEGVAQNSSIEDGESVKSSAETEKQGDKADTKDRSRKGNEELLNGAHDGTIAQVDKNTKLKECLVPGGESSQKKPSLDRPTGGAAVSEEERQKKSYEAEVKSWLLERMHAPIEGRNHMSIVVDVSRSLCPALNSTVLLCFVFTSVQTCFSRPRRRVKTLLCSCASKLGSP